MIKLFCKHDYELLHRVNIFSSRDDKYEIPYKIVYVYLCKKCGKFKKVSIGQNKVI